MEATIRGHCDASGEVDHMSPDAYELPLRELNVLGPLLPSLRTSVA
jgi:hypothetical protein